MRILVSGKWKGGFLDYWRAPEEYRIEVTHWQNLERLQELFFVRPRRPRLVLNYLREVGLRAVARKVRSRLGERRRNEKLLSWGVGRVIDGPVGVDGPRQGSWVAFLAPAHPACVERVVLPRALIASTTPRPSSGGNLVYRPLGTTTRPSARVGGWQREAGSSMAGVDADADLHDLVATLDRDALPSATELRRGSEDRVAERTSRRGVFAARRLAALPASRRGRPRPSAVLFGYGNYAKTSILPNVKRSLDVRCVHEIDPTQMPRWSVVSNAWDTAPHPRVEESYDVYLVAGYHASHAPIAVEALDRGASAVVEKPVAMDQGQLASLLAAMENSAGEVFCCYQRRYSWLTELGQRDLGLSVGEPISYHCIVYEVPLPALHWYRWPSSGSRLLSNGCHWVDHFLYLNSFAAVRAVELAVAGDSTINCSLELENGAVFTMVLTDVGSGRIGVQDHVELRARDKTVRIVNDSRYVAEDANRVLRRTAHNKTRSYEVMYSEIARKLAAGEKGDSPESVRVSAGAALALEQRLLEKTNREGSRS
jgi:predicted dehydrogenase